MKKLKQLLINTILRVDLLSSSPTFRIKNKHRFQTIFGGIVSLIIVIVFSYILYIQLFQMINYKNIHYTQTSSEDIDSKDVISDIKFAISIDDLDLSLKPYKFNFKLTKIYRNYSNRTLSNIQLVPCTAKQWQKLGPQFQDQFNTLGFNKMLCIKDGQDISLTGFCLYYIFSIMRLQITKCDINVNPNCDTSENIDDYLNNRIINNGGFINIKLYFMDTIISPQNVDPITLVVQKKIFLSFCTAIGSTGYVSLSKYTLITDQSPWPIKMQKQITGNFIESFHTNQITQKQFKYITLDIQKSSKSIIIKRILNKYDAALSYVGGLFGMVFGLIAFLIGSYSQRKYQLYVGQIFIRNNDQNDLNHEDFTFIMYIGYCIFNWLDAFGLTPSFKYLKEVDDMRGQVSSLINPVVILKRLKFIQNVYKILINDREKHLIKFNPQKRIYQSRKMRMMIKVMQKVIIKLHSSKTFNKMIETQAEKKSALLQNNQLIKIMLKNKLIQALLFSSQISSSNSQQNIISSSIYQSISFQTRKCLLQYLNHSNNKLSKQDKKDKQDKQDKQDIQDIQDKQDKLNIKQQLVYIDLLQSKSQLQQKQQKALKKSIYRQPKRNRKNQQQFS